MSLNEALFAAQQEIPSIQKSAVNPHFKSKYVPLEKLVEVVLPILHKHGLLLTQFPGFIAHGQGVEPALVTRITHVESGEFVQEHMLLILDKQTPQAQGAAITYARRYGIMAALGVVADLDDDAESAMSRGGGQARRRSTTRKTNDASSGVAGTTSGVDLDDALG